MTLVAVDEAGDLESRSRVWRYGDHQITMLTIDGSVAAGLTNLLAAGPPETVTVAGAEGMLVTTAPQTVVGWTPRTAWVTLTIPAPLAGEAGDIVRALQRG